MELSGAVDSRLWAAVHNAYEAGNYTGAILDSIHYLSELIRNKSGLDSDGNALVGSAFGGQNPVIKVNPLHTESDRDEQRGVEQLLRGVYTAIRNPRSHEKREDPVESADAIIFFVDYLTALIDKSRSPFDTQQIIERVFDRHFAQNEKYADLLVARIPMRKRLEVLSEIFRRRGEGRSKSIVYFTTAVLKTLSAEEQAAFWEMVSEELEIAVTDSEFRSAIQLAEDDWLKVSEVARLRCENRLIESISEGEYDAQRKTCPKGSLGTWARDIAKHFTLQTEYVVAVLGRLQSSDPAARAYAIQYHLFTLKAVRPEPTYGIVQVLRQCLMEGDASIHDALSFLKREPKESGWVKQLKEAYDNFIPAIADDNIPF